MAKREPKGTKQKLEAAAERARKPRLKAQPLPGLENLRIQELDDICATISGVRETLNEARQEEAEHLQTALGLMRSHRKQTWQAAGVELVRVPGTEKLRARTVKQKATAETDEDATTDPSVPF